MRKTLLILIIILFTSITGFAQIAKNTYLLGGNASLNFSSRFDTYLFLNPNIGIFVTDKVALGVSMPLFWFDNLISFGFSPFARYYFQNNTDKSFFLSSSLGFTGYKQKNSSFETDDYSLGLGVGHVTLITDNIGLEINLNGITDFTDIDASLLVGFQIYFRKK